MRLAALVAALLLIAPTFPAAALAQAVTGEGTPIIPTATEADYAAVVAHAVDDYVIPAYTTLHDATRDLAAQVEGFCAAPGAETRAAMADGFAATVKAWAGVDFLRFGPIVRDNRYDRFAFFPDVHGTGARQLRRFLAGHDESLLAPGALADQSAAVQGLPALESLLYSGSKGLAEAADESEPYRCALALAVARNMEAIAGAALAGWQGVGSWAALIEKPSSDNPVYRTHKEAMTEILKAILTGLEQMRDHRLEAALGDSPQDGKASRAPYDRAGLALAYLDESAAALQRFVETSGILGLVPEQAWIANSTGFEFGNLKRTLADAGGDLQAALADPDKRGKLEYATVVLASLRDLLQRQLGPFAGLTAGFNSLDGD